MKRLVIAVGAVCLASACENPDKVVPAHEPLFVTNDCNPVSAVARDYYKFGAGDGPMRLRLNGEDAAWRPGCDWKAAGFNFVEVSGPEGLAATASLGEVTFNRPKYDKEGALVRTTLKRGAEAPQRLLCRVGLDAGKWSVASCGPDAKALLPRAAAPSPEDATPENTRIAPPTEGQKPTARDAKSFTPDPGAPRQ